MIEWLRDRLIKREYIQLGVDGTFCTMTPMEACHQLQDSDDPKDYVVRSVRMTKHHFENLPEFMGY